MMAEATGLRASNGGYVVGATDGEVEARTVVIASGSRPRKLGVPGEDRFEGRGISHCASCDGPMLRGKPVVVVGAGDSGLQEALTLADFASEVVVLERSEAPTAQAVYRARVRENSIITLRTGSVEEVVGESSVTGVRLQDRTLIETAALFVYVGLEPNTEWLGGILETEERRIPTDIWMRTKLPGVFAAGDVRAGSACQAITAAGDGATAAVAAHRYLESCL